MSDEQALIAAGRGKWSIQKFPRTGWACVEIEDCGKSQLICQMCELQKIRFIHFMQHPAFPGVLKCGCVCAGHMEGNLTVSRQREASMKSRAAKRKRWITRPWKISSKGNPYISADGFRITVYPRNGGWACTVAAEMGSGVHHSRLAYRTVNEARLSAFDQITRLLVLLLHRSQSPCSRSD